MFDGGEEGPGARRGERGQGMVEYAFILVLVAMVVLVSVIVLGKQTSNLYSNISSGLGARRYEAHGGELAEAIPSRSDPLAGVPRGKRSPLRLAAEQALAALAVAALRTRGGGHRAFRDDLGDQLAHRATHLGLGVRRHERHTAGDRVANDPRVVRYCTATGLRRLCSINSWLKSA